MNGQAENIMAAYNYRDGYGNLSVSRLMKERMAYEQAEREGAYGQHTDSNYSGECENFLQL